MQSSGNHKNNTRNIMQCSGDKTTDNSINKQTISIIFYWCMYIIQIVYPRHFLAFIAALLHKVKDFVAFLHYMYVLFLYIRINDNRKI